MFIFYDVIKLAQKWQNVTKNRLFYHRKIKQVSHEVSKYVRNILPRNIACGNLNWTIMSRFSDLYIQSGKIMYSKVWIDIFPQIHRNIEYWRWKEIRMIYFVKFIKFNHTGKSNFIWNAMFEYLQHDEIWSHYFALFVWLEEIVALPSKL